jgi:hypothetical protein
MFDFFRLSQIRVVSDSSCHRLLQVDIETAKGVINPALPPVVAFSEEQSPELRDRIFDEFNSLAVIYREPSSSFVVQTPTTVGHQETLMVRFQTELTNLP